ncbi:PDDEXK nuclease domain-containing protein [Leptolyngbya sp. NIES-2104]|uniref:PDDEXK nuclease domain-containing protein n=1 Tax=Leptolyngbya sp. NIES-2104 TaxID=1552121 RepID=UPI00073F0CBB|nr:PDDEXK nuclease domain-containing protein [Leptolyngbya sp. NIES-2104]
MPKQRSSLLPNGYDDFLHNLKERIRSAQVRAALAVNRELVLLYWQIGQQIRERQQRDGWGAKVIEKISKDLQQEFPEIKGFSRSNLMYMRAFAEAYEGEEIVQRCVGQLPWRHNIALLEKLKSLDMRLWYGEKAIENGWSRDVLVYQIESKLFERQGGAITNFERTLPKPQSDFAQQLIKDPYHLNFLSLGENPQERELEQGLVTHIRDFLLELGVGFSFVGSQYHLEVDGDDYYLDLLFYHLKLRCFIVIDLKMVEFQPEFSGKMNFYVSAVDDLLRHTHDQPTIGIILCKSKSKTKAEYALRNLNTPIAVSTHRLPQQLQESLPSVEQLEMKLEALISDIQESAQQTELDLK